MSGTEKKLILTLTEAGELLGLSQPTVYKLAQEENWPTKKIGRGLTISRKFLEHWIDKQFPVDTRQIDQKLTLAK